MSRWNARCRYCQAEIIWAATEKGKRMPLDVRPVDPQAIPGALFVLRQGNPPLAVAVTPAWFAGNREAAFVSHRATCPVST